MCVNILAGRNVWFYQIVNNGQEENTFFSLQRKECGEKWMVFLGGGGLFFFAFRRGWKASRWTFRLRYYHLCCLVHICEIMWFKQLLVTTITFPCAFFTLSDGPQTAESLLKPGTRQTQCFSSIYVSTFLPALFDSVGINRQGVMEMAHKWVLFPNWINSCLKLRRHLFPPFVMTRFQGPSIKIFWIHNEAIL